MSEYYSIRINKAVVHINQHLGEELSIALLADIAHFSSYHFQRVYKAIQGETPYDTILRLRLQKAVFYLKHYRQKRIGEIAHQVGFPSSENFSRQFKQRFGHSPSHLRKNLDLLKSRIYQEEKENSFQLAYDESRNKPTEHFTVEILESPPIQIALTKAVFGTDGSGLVEAYEELMIWYEAMGNHRTGSRRFGMSIDDPDATPANFYRYDFGVEMTEGFEAEGLIEKTEIPGGLYAVVHCQGDILKVSQVWDYLFKVWLPESGYVPRHFPSIEEFLKGPEEIGWETFDILCKIPIVKI